MREEIIDVLVRIRLLRVVDDPDEEFDRLSLVGEVARLVGATPDELGQALLRINILSRATAAPARER